MSLSNREFFESLEDGQSYISCFTTEEAYNLIPKEVQEQMLINEIRQTNVDFSNDETHKKLLTNYSKAKKELRDYEYNQNHK